jgi:hypothetical protein
MGKISILLGIIFSMYYILMHNNQITDKIEDLKVRRRNAKNKRMVQLK